MSTGDRTSTTRRPAPEDVELAVDLLAGVEPGAYVVIRWDELAHQARAAFLDTPDHGGRYRPHRAVARLGLVLAELGYTHRVVPPGQGGGAVPGATPRGGG